MKFSLATLVTYFLVCLITAQDYEAGNTKSGWPSSAARPNMRRRETLENAEPATYSTPASWPTAVQPSGGRTLIGTKGRTGPYYEDGNYRSSGKTLFGKGSRWRGPRCARTKPALLTKLETASDLVFSSAGVCVASCMGIFWRHQEIQDICQLAD
ncbi:hypothetical protein MTO96_033999 [Rhipicephalus appendiculatus]